MPHRCVIGAISTKVSPVFQNLLRPFQLRRLAAVVWEWAANTDSKISRVIRIATVEDSITWPYETISRMRLSFRPMFILFALQALPATGDGKGCREILQTALAEHDPDTRREAILALSLRRPRAVYHNGPVGDV